MEKASTPMVVVAGSGGVNINLDELGCKPLPMNEATNRPSMHERRIPQKILEGQKCPSDDHVGNSTSAKEQAETEASKDELLLQRWLALLPRIVCNVTTKTHGQARRAFTPEKLRMVHDDTASVMKTKKTSTRERLSGDETEDASRIWEAPDD